MSVAYEDKVLVCRDCDSEFSFTVGEQEFYASKGLENQPTRCPDCRRQRRAQRENGQTSPVPRRIHEVTCGRCGGIARVPFLPSQDKPVYCSPCFEQVRVR